MSSKPSLSERLLNDLPWSPIFEFLTLSEIAHLPSVSRSFCQQLVPCGFSPQAAASRLQPYLQGKNAFILTSGTIDNWKTATNESVSDLTTYFSPSAVSSPTGLSKLATSMKQDEPSSILRKLLATLRLLSEFSAPSIRVEEAFAGPGDHMCPVCRHRGRLKKHIWSYKGREGDPLAGPDGYELELPKNIGDSSLDSKRQKISIEDWGETTDPDRRNGCMIPHCYTFHFGRFNFINYNSLHCTYCERFMVVQPIALCYDPRFECLQHRQALVSRRCSFPNCNRATLCNECAGRIRHPPRRDGEATIAHQSHCAKCGTYFCREHAWQSTCCCHL